MSDFEWGAENSPSSTGKTPSASPCNSLNVNKQGYQPKQIEKLLKICTTDPKQYTIVKNVLFIRSMQKALKNNPNLFSV